MQGVSGTYVEVSRVRIKREKNRDIPGKTRRPLGNGRKFSDWRSNSLLVVIKVLGLLINGKKADRQKRSKRSGMELRGPT